MVFNKRRREILKCIKSIYKGYEYRPSTSISFSVRVHANELETNDLEIIEVTANHVGYMVTRSMRHIGGYMISFQKYA